MSTLLSSIEAQARKHILEDTPGFWTSAELIAIINLGVKDLWRDTADLKQEHFLTVDNTNVSLAASATSLSGVPADVHKVYLIEPRDITPTSASSRLVFRPMDYNSATFQAARGSSAMEATAGVVYYAITGQGSPVAAPVIRIAPSVTSPVNLSFAYVPTLATLLATDTVPIPGEADTALIAWTIAYARAKEQEDRAPDAAWISVYSTEKQHLLQSLGLRQYQEPSYADALFEDCW